MIPKRKAPGCLDLTERNGMRVLRVKTEAHLLDWVEIELTPEQAMDLGRRLLGQRAAPPSVRARGSW